MICFAVFLAFVCYFYDILRFRGPRQTGDGYNAGGKKKEHPRMDAPSWGRRWNRLARDEDYISILPPVPVP